MEKTGLWPEEEKKEEQQANKHSQQTMMSVSTHNPPSTATCAILQLLC